MGGGSPNKSTSESTSPALRLAFFGAYELGILVILQGFFFFQLLEM
jgi:hypothetical protein